MSNPKKESPRLIKNPVPATGTSGEGKVPLIDCGTPVLIPTSSGKSTYRRISTTVTRVR
jgi:hypothetical protein